METGQPANAPLQLEENQENLSRKISRRKLSKRCLCGMSSLIVVAVLLGLFIAAVSLEKTCNDEECVKYAEEILSNMDESIDPCDNFYKFACGKYAANNPIPEDKSRITSFSKTSDLLDRQLIKILEEPIEKSEAKHFQDLKKYYKSCRNTDKIEEIGLKEVKRILETLGGWPVVEDINPNIRWDSVLYGLNKIGLDADYLMRLFVHTDFENSTVRILGIEAPSFQLTRALLVEGKSDRTIKAYYDFMVHTAILFGAKEETAKREMELALDFEIYLAEKTKSPEEIAANIRASHNLYTIEKLEMEFPGIPWSNYMENFTGKSLDRNIQVNLFQPDYTKSLTEILKATPARVIRNYVIWRAIWYMVPFLNEELRILEHAFIEVLSGQSSLWPKPTLCLAIINILHLPVESALYVRKYFDPHSKTIATELVNYIRDQFEKILKKTTWPEQDKVKAIEKLKSIYAHVGFPNELLDDEKLNSVYKTLEINEDNFLQSSLNIKKLHADFQYNRLFIPINKTDWIDFSISALVDAIYEPKINAMVLPAAILQGVFFNAKFPRYINFGAIGSVIGHEISHGFDNTGRQYNKDGALEKWWSEIAEQDYAEKARCLVEQFDNFTMFGLKINGNLTLGENMADFGGVKSSYLSYQNWKLHHKEPKLPGLNYTDNQLFWIASANIWCSNIKEENFKFQLSADTHSPEELRVNVPLSNLKMFSKDFNCRIGSNMNPEKKCTPW